jgi:hypothetical protein
MIAFFLMLLIGFTGMARAENPPATATPGATAAAAAPIVYELRNLRPAGITQYSSGGEILRQYFDFQNEQGSHHVIYEEVPALAPARTAAALRQFAGTFDSHCSMDVECTAKAFCMEGCKHMYYEISNAAADSISPERDNCRVLFFTCEKSGISAPAAVAPSVPPVK